MTTDADLVPVCFILRPDDGTAWRAVLVDGEDAPQYVQFRSLSDARAAINSRPDISVVVIDDHGRKSYF